MISLLWYDSPSTVGQGQCLPPVEAQQHLHVHVYGLLHVSGLLLGGVQSTPTVMSGCVCEQVCMRTAVQEILLSKC